MENKNLNNFSTADRRTVKLHKFNPLHILNNNAVSENRISKSKMADGAILNFLNFTKIWISLEPLNRFRPNFNPCILLWVPRHRLGQLIHFSKSKMADGTGWKFTINRITSKRFIRLAPGLAIFDQKRMAYRIPYSNCIIFEHKMAADGHFKFKFMNYFRFFHWNSPQATIVDRFWRVIRQNAWFDATRCLLGFTKIQISVFTTKIPQNPNFLVLSMRFLWKTKILITYQENYSQIVTVCQCSE